MTETARQAVMPEAELTEEMVAQMRARAGTDLRIDHSIFNEEATRLAVVKFAGGIGDINPLWTDPDHARRSPWGGPVAPPSFVMGCFSGIQFGWPGLGSFHSASRLRFHRPVYWGDAITSTCRYEGFSGPTASRFAGRMVTDHFANRYVNQRDENVAEIDWDVVNFERATARAQGDRQTQSAQSASEPPIPHPWGDDELDKLRAQVLSEQPRGADPRWFEDVAVGDELDPLTKGPIGLTDEVAFVAGGGAPIPRLSAHAVALHAYDKHPAWCFRDPETGALEPIYSVHYNRHAANAMGVTYQYDVGFQRQCWQVQHLTHWCSDAGWVKTAEAQYRRFVYLSDVVVLAGVVTERFVDDDGEACVRIETRAENQRGENVMPGSAVVALPSRAAEGSPAARRARQSGVS
ncbi:MAG: FAS1-like dehydratase domain-containing protein [Acidimicrobiia bacterium]